MTEAELWRLLADNPKLPFTAQGSRMLRRSDLPMPKEDHEQRRLASWLDSRRRDGQPLVWTHTANGRKRSKVAGAKLKREGLKRGVPDVLIFDPPLTVDAVGVALELKRAGREYRPPTLEQMAWLRGLSDRGWYVCVARGFDDAREQLEALGY